MLRSAPVPTTTPPLALGEIGLEDLSGCAIRGYALGERIGAVGFGAVYRAVQALVEREVAVKIILPHYANTPTLFGALRLRPSSSPGWSTRISSRSTTIGASRVSPTW